MTALGLLLVMTSCKCKTWNGEGDACISCHEGIEQVHPEFAPNECTDCHGGDEEALELEDAHVPVPANWAELRGDLPTAPDGFIKDFPPDLLDQLDPDYLKFINPGDIRVAGETCGDCHPDEVKAMAGSVMTTNAGHYMPTRMYAGLQDRTPIYGSMDVIDPDYTGEEGTVESLTVLRPPTGEEIDDAIAAAEAGDITDLERVAYDHYLAKNCNTCHAAGYPKNNSKALYRSTGCSSCHMVYAEDGVYQGDDAAMPKSHPVYPRRHELTTEIPTEQCATCHFQGGRIGLNFQGIREGGFSDTPPNADTWQENVYGHTAGYYLFDEDTTNSYDETPPDLHHEAGMVCGDCHVGPEVHGGGPIHATSKTQQTLICEDCHGTVREPVSPDADGKFWTGSGYELVQLGLNDDGQVSLTGSVDHQEHVVTQVAQVLDERGETSKMHAAMGVSDEDWSHTDSLTCDTCHNSWQLQCLGCHVTMDLRLDQIDYQTGEKTPGFTTGSREWYSLEHVLLCQSDDGRAQSCNSSQQAQMTVKDEDGEPIFEGLFRENEDYTDITGWSPFFQHTASRTPRSCSTCHRTDGTDAEWRRVKGVYGYGTGEFMLEHPGGEVDALQFLDEDGDQVSDFVHPNTGPLATDVIERALAVEVE
ncbi:MAG: hypothetical protein GY913_24535 [Proteobacteria bacterium]|nr:hypothetical protein [Pseudomonadota bacterium]MCP4920082.1 hypothetical protein [Pseudomonadota bacterium]